MKMDVSSFDSTKVEKRSTTRESTTAARRSHLTKPATKCSNSCVTVTALNDQLEVRGGPPAMLPTATNSKPQTINLNVLSRCAQGNTLITHGKNSPPATSPIPNRPVPSVLSVGATLEKPPKPLDATAGNRNNCCQI